MYATECSRNYYFPQQKAEIFYILKHFVFCLNMQFMQQGSEHGK